MVVVQVRNILNSERKTTADKDLPSVLLRGCAGRADADEEWEQCVRT